MGFNVRYRRYATHMPDRAACGLTMIGNGLKNARSGIAVAVLLGLGACSALPGSVKPDVIYSGTGEAADKATEGSPQTFPQLSNVPEKRPIVTSQAARDVLARQLELQREKSISDSRALEADPTGSPTGSANPAPDAATVKPQSSLAPAKAGAKVQLADAVIPMPPIGGHATLDSIDPALAREVALLSAQTKTTGKIATARAKPAWKAVAWADPEPVVKAAPTIPVAMSSLSQ